ncbi:pyridoxamine 5'-phosphate oxidase family protein [Actinomarinicola tropica]|uniref:Pyridoxamine 5'-phosphate oxidase family protein n=1 Tax=Actinomarinicola tropica TaxID=2789776 RepID=A0A5Q2RJ90_9ACTN|nr:pyridoxamine 5'-phosphate oxidase family protein [Actinomarinicola tropica]QGG94456.1 pyridoxamine 5'-phosphate oxidase family protein [Actinomarinicola tropica]
MSTPTPPASVRSTVRRHPERGAYDREAVHAVLDEGLVAHVGLTVEGQPFVIPMAYGRDGDRLLLHGSVASRLMRGLAGGVPACVTVTLLDGLVMARSAFHHSMNYRSVVALGTARRIDDPDEAAAALGTFVEHLVPGRGDEVRPSAPVEVRQTTVLEMSIEEASLKARTGGPVDDEADLDLPVWAGVVPLGVAVGEPISAPDAEHLPVSPSVRAWSRPGPTESVQPTAESV